MQQQQQWYSRAEQQQANGTHTYIMVDLVEQHQSYGTTCPAVVQQQGLMLSAELLICAAAAVQQSRATNGTHMVIM